MNSESDHQPRGPAPPAEPAAPEPPEPPESAAPAPSAETAPPSAHGEVTDVTAPDDPPRPGPQGDISPEEVREHLRRRAIFLRELAEARELRARVTPHRSRRARIHAQLRRRTFRIN
ncbi:hypothetical protein GCM10009735_19470 [Actinomadura chokoriensis]